MNACKEAHHVPKFSVIVPIYNVEKYLTQCIDSILNQTYTDIEVVLVDDGSPDRCPAICDEYQRKDKRVKVIHKKNCGVSMARQDGVAMAKGEYLVFVDGDDRIIDNYFEIISKHTDVDIIRFGYVVERSDGTLLDRTPKERAGFYEKRDIEKDIYPYLIQSDVATYYCHSLWCHVFKRELFIANMLKDKVIKIGEDAACVIPCIYRAQSLFCIHKCLYVYNYNEASATRGKKIYPWDGPMLIAEHLRDRIDVTMHDFQHQLYRKTAHELFSVVMSQFHKQDSYGNIIKDIRHHLELREYTECIKKAKFMSFAGRVMVFAMRYKLFLLMKVYHKLKNWKFA